MTGSFDPKETLALLLSATGEHLEFASGAYNGVGEHDDLVIATASHAGTGGRPDNRRPRSSSKRSRSRRRPKKKQRAMARISPISMTQAAPLFSRGRQWKDPNIA